MKWFFSATLALALTLSSSAFGQYRLGESDKLRIKIQQWPDLGGDYTVDPEGFIAIPLIGDIKAAGLGTHDVAREISDRLQQRSGDRERPFAAVEVLQYRPYFVVGDVQNPGLFPFRPGLNVLEAIGVAGGYFRTPDAGPLRLERDVLAAKGDVETQTLRLLELLARAARLEAALRQGADIVFPQELQARQKDPAVAQIMDGERQALALERDNVQRDDEALDAIRSLYQRQIASLQGQINALKGERDLMRKHLGDLQSLAVRGLGLASTQFSLEREIAQNANEQQSIGTAIVSAQEGVVLAEQKTRDEAIDRQRADNRDLQQARAEIADARARIVTAESLIGEAEATASETLGARLARAQERRSIVVVRRQGERTQDIPAEETTSVQPGDVIKVMRRSQDLGAGAASLRLLAGESAAAP